MSKPAGLGTVPYEASRADPYVRTMWEAWNEDRTAYLCVVLGATSSKGASPAQRLDETSFAGQRRGTWFGNVETPSVVGKEKDWLSRSQLGRQKAFTYQLRGQNLGIPFVERGYFLRFKQSVYSLYFQFGGTDAEKKMETLRAAVVAALGF